MPKRSVSIILLALLVTSAGVSRGEKLEGFDPDLAKIPPFPVTAFYETPTDVASLAVGTVLRTEPIPGPPNALAWRVLYVSERWNGDHVPASGMVITSKSAGPDAGRRVIAWAHGTTGAARGCAPSLAPNPVREITQRGGAEQLPIDIGIPYLNDWLEQGYTIVAPDYAGLGSDAVHHYMVGDDEARDVHNLLRASRSMPDAKAGDEAALIGWSQGGHAVLFAGEIGAAYAPDNKIRAIVALAPGSTVVMAPEATNAFFAASTPYPYLIGQSYLDAYKTDQAQYSKTGQALLAAAQRKCVVGLFTDIAQNTESGVTGAIMDHPDWVKALTKNNAGLQKSETAVLVIHGVNDTVVPPEATKAYMQRATAAGTDVTVKWVRNAGHRELFDNGKATIIDWVDTRLASR